MTAPTFFFPPGDDTGHSVCLTAWTGGILLPRKETPTAFNLVLGASGLAPETVIVSGTTLGFVGATEDVSGRAWLLDYTGDVTLLSTAGQQVFSLPTAASGDVFVGAVLCLDHPYFVASDGDIFTVVGNAITQVTPGFGAQVNSVSTDGTKLYATLPLSTNLATYTFSSQTAGAVSTVATPLTATAYVAAGIVGLPGGFTGSQNTGGSNPVITGPVSGVISEGTLVAVLGVSILDTVEAASGLCSAAFSCISGTITVTGSRTITGNGTKSVTISDSFANIQTCAGSMLYQAPAAVGVDSLSLRMTDSLSNNHTLTVPVSVVTPTFQSTVAVGGWTNSSIVSGAAWFNMNQAGTNVVIANTPANRIVLLDGPEPDWDIVQAVSGTGAPTSAMWASSGEQVLVADPTNGKVQVFNFISGALVPGQVITLTGASSIAVSADQLTAFVTQPGSNSLSVLSNNVNTWSVTQTLTLSTASSCVVISPLEIAVGINGGVSFVQKGGATWAVTTTITGLGFTPVSLATDGNANVYATGGTGTGHLASLNINGITTSTTWSGNGNAVFYEQGQLAVADSANALVRTFSALGTITQQNSLASPSGCVFIGYTDPSVWVCGVSGIAQDAFTAPFKLVKQKAGAVSVLFNGQFTTAQLEVGHQPTAGAWNNGVFWSTTLQNDLDQISTSGVVLNDDVLSPESVGLNGLVPPLGISAMLWSGGSLYAASSLNESLAILAGTIPAGTIIAPSAPIGLTALNITGASITLGWTASLTGTEPEYQVQFRVTGSTAFVSFGGQVTTTSLTVTGLQPLTSYDFQVIAINSAGSATSAPPFTVATNNLAVSAPTGLTLTAATSSSLTATWQASNGSPPIAYQPQIRITGSGAAFANSGPSTGNTSIVITGLAPDTSFDVQIAASNAAGNATSAPVSSSTLGIAPSAPGTPVVQSVTSSTVSLTWAASATSAPAPAYQPQFELAVSGTFANFGSPISTTNVVVSGLVFSTAYEFQVIASNPFGSATSASASGMTSVSGSTWNPNDETGMSLSLSNLDATTDVNTSTGIRSTTSKNTGKFYVELTANSSAQFEAFGFANSGWVTSDPNGLGGPDLNSLGVTTDGGIFFGNNQVGSGDPWIVGDILGIALDITHKEFWYRVNGNNFLGANSGANPSVSGTGISFSSLNAGPYFMAFSGTTLIGSITGTQTSGTSQPIVFGPGRATAILNRDAEDIPFDSTTSFWTAGIGSGATWGAVSGTAVKHLQAMSGTVNSTSFGEPIYFGNSDDSFITITCTDTALPVPPQQLYVPKTATPAGPAVGGNHNMSFYDSSQPTTFWSYSGCTLNNGVDVTGGITAQTGAVWDTTGDGFTNSVTPGTDYNFAIGSITDYDLAQGVIRHALRCVMGITDLHSPGATNTTNIPYPNTHEDLAGPTTYTGPITYGSTIGIPATTSLTTRGLTTGGLMLATALQTYGMTIRGSGPVNNQIALSTTPENASNPLITQMISDLPKIIPLLNIMQNQSTNGAVGTINGGGTYPPALLPINPGGGGGSVQLATTGVTDTNQGGTATPTSVIPSNAVISNMHPAGQLAAYATGSFTAGQRCSNAGNAYQCISPGTSTVAPTGNASSINNGGQAVFEFLSSIDFTSIQAFFNSLANQTLTAPQALMIWNDGPILGVNGTQIVNDFELNITTSPQNPIIITTAPGESFKGKVVTAAFNEANGVSVVTPSSGSGAGGGWILLGTENVIFDGIQFHDPNPNSGTIFFNLAGSGCRIQHFILVGQAQANFCEMFYLPGSNINVTNFLVIDNKTDAAGAFTLKYDTPNGSGNVANGVFYAPNGVSLGASAAAATLTASLGNMNLTNVAIFGYGFAVQSQNLTGAATATNCATDQSSFDGGTGGVTLFGTNLFNQTLTNIFNSTSDFREKSGSPTIGAGKVDTTDIPTADDFFGRARGTTSWDIGLYQFNVAAAAALNTVTLTCGAGELVLPASGTVSGNFTDSVTIVDTFANCNNLLNQLFYNASDVLGQDTVTVTFTNSINLTNSITIPITIAASDPASKTINFGLSAFGFATPAGFVAWD